MAPLAYLEVWHSRPVAPTRRVALGFSHLPTDPAPGAGGLLLGAVVGSFIHDLDDDLRDELDDLIDDLLQLRRVPQPRLRHRLQVDRVGLTRSVHRLLGEGDRLRLDLCADVLPAPQVLAAVYEAGRQPVKTRRTILELVRRGVHWHGVGGEAELFRHLSGNPQHRIQVPGTDPVEWALAVLGFDESEDDRKVIQRRFRQLLVEAHPDHGAGHEEAAVRIDELTQARRILLSS